MRFLANGKITDVPIQPYLFADRSPTGVETAYTTMRLISGEGIWCLVRSQEADLVMLLKTLFEIQMV